MKPHLLNALSALGIAVFAVGAAVVPVYFSLLGIFAHNGLYADLAFPVLLISAAVWLCAGIRYAIRPGTPRYWWRALASVILFVGAPSGARFA